jgi:hypothetical protein
MRRWSCLAIALFVACLLFSCASGEGGDADSGSSSDDDDDDNDNDDDDAGDDDSSPPETLRREISNRNPLFIHNFYADSGPGALQDFWAALPEDIRPYWGLQLVPASPKKDTPECRAWLETTLSAAQELSAPAFIQVDSFNTRSDFPASYWRGLFDRFSTLIGLSVAEFSASGLTIFSLDADQIERIKRYIDIAADNNAYFLWQDMGYEWAWWGLHVPHVFMKAGADPGLYDKIVRNGRHVILQDKHNGKGRRFAGPAAAIGFWASGLIGNWGVNSEDWIWWEAGYSHLYQPSSGFARTGDDWRTVFSFPDAQFGMDWLLDLAGGATVYSLEAPFHGAFAEACASTTPAFNQVLLPLIRLILVRHLIPTREEVRNKIQVAYHPLTADPPEMKNDELFQGLYGPAEESLYEWMPSTGRYYYLPILPVLADAAVLALYPQVIDSAYYRDHFSDQQAKVEFFDGVYPPIGAGDAWFANVGEHWLIVNPNENSDVTATFDLPFSTDFFAGLSGRFSPHTFAIAWQADDGVHVHLSNYRIDSEADVWTSDALANNDPMTYVCGAYIPNPTDGALRASRLVFHETSGGPPVVSIECGHLCEHAEDFADGELTIDLAHNGTVDVVVQAQAAQ